MGEFGVKEFFVGGFAGATGIAVGHPIDTLRIRYQTENTAFMQIFRETIRNESVWGLYKGMLSPLSSCFAFNAILFYSYSKTKAHFQSLGWGNYTSQAIGGGVGGFACATVTGPTELVKIKMQVLKDKRNAPFKGSFSCAVYMLRTNGPKSLLRGFTATIIRDVPGYIAYFLSYQICKDKFVGNCTAKIWEQSPHQLVGQLGAGAVAGVVGWLPGYPFEVIKTRIQAEQYNSIRSCIVGSIKKDGYQVFTRGLALTLFRAVPVNATTFLVYETLMDVLGKKREPLPPGL